MTSRCRDANSQGCFLQSCGEFRNDVIDFPGECYFAHVVGLDCSYADWLLSYEKYVSCGSRASTRRVMCRFASIRGFDSVVVEGRY